MSKNEKAKKAQFKMSYEAKELLLDFIADNRAEILKFQNKKRNNVTYDDAIIYLLKKKERVS